MVMIVDIVIVIVGRAAVVAVLNSFLSSFLYSCSRSFVAVVVVVAAAAAAVVVVVVVIFVVS